MNDNGTHPAQQTQYLVIGAGPAGLQLGYHLQQAGRDYLILEAGESAGTFFKRFPRHRQLISNNKIYTGYTDPEINLRFDWNSLLGDSDEMLFKHYSESYFPRADEMVKYLEDYARHYQLKIKYGKKVKRISRGENGGFTLETGDGERYGCERLVVATGFTKAYVPEIEGIELGENYTEMSVDPAEYRNQRVLIIGKGNSAFESADNLIGAAAIIHVASPNPVSMAWKTHFVGHLRAVNNNFLDTYQLKSQNAVLDATVEKLERRDGKIAVSVSYSHAEGEREDLLYDRVLVCTGWQFDSTIFDEGCRPALTLNNRFPAQTSEWESTNVKDLYFAGTLTQVLDYKKATSGFIHGFRYNVRALYRIFEQKYHNVEWPRRTVRATSQDLVEAVIGRVNTSSALWQQFGFLCDLIVVQDPGGEAQYYEEMPLAYVRKSELGKSLHYTVTLEFGKVENDPFNIPRNPSPEHAARSAFLHPVIRFWVGDQMLSEHHMLEDLAGEWFKQEAHIRPLQEFFEATLSAPHSGVGDKSYITEGR